MDEFFHIADLIVKKIRGRITASEQEELDRWISESPENQELFDRASHPGKQLEKAEIYKLFDQERAWTKLEDELFGKETIRFTPNRWLRYAAAILLPLIVGGGFAWWYLRAPSTQTFADIDLEIQPGSQKAVLILSDGKRIELGQGTSVATLFDGQVSISDAESRVRYTSEAEDSHGEELFNELRTPRGGGYQLQLADGTRVWLNAGSSLRYPLSFRDSLRQVRLDGEAYFEVNRNGKPFIVRTGTMHTRVLGTSFNVSAYADDAAFKTTLVEGKVRVELLDPEEHISASTLLEPDQQATYVRGSEELARTDVSASGYVSWMQGKLEFHNEALDVVMRKLARWYDFEYSFENEAARDFRFSARLDRDERMSTILEMLEMTTDVKFVYRANRIVVQ